MGGTLIDTYSPVNALFAAKVADAGGEISPAGVAILTRRSISSAIQTLAQRFLISEGELHAAYDSLKASWQDTPAPLIAGARRALEAIVGDGGVNVIVTHRDRPSATTLLEQHDLSHLISDMICAPTDSRASQIRRCSLRYLSAVTSNRRAHSLSAIVKSM